MDLAGNALVLLHVPDKVDLADNVQVLRHDLAVKADNVLVVQVDKVQVELHHIVQVEIPVAVHQVQVDLIVQVDNVQDLAVAEILQVHSVRVDQRRVTRRRVRKRCVMISKTCKRLHLVA